MEFTKEELNKVRIKKDGVGIHEIPLHYDYLVERPELTRLGGFAYGFFAWGSTDDSRIIARNKIIRYINFMYSMELDCIKAAYPEYDKRKVACAIQAGFDYDPDNGKFGDLVEKMMDGENEVVNYMIVEFLRHSYSDMFSAIVTLREKYYEGMKKLRNNKDATTTDIMKWKETADILQKMEQEFLSGDKSKPLNASLVMKIEEEGLGLRPEDIAYAIKEGRSPLGDFEFYRAT